MKKQLLTPALILASAAALAVSSVVGTDKSGTEKSGLASMQPQAVTPAAPTQALVSSSENFGQSIGTVEAMPYSSSEFDFEWFDYNVQYVAQVGENTHMGFYTDVNGWVEDEETGDEWYDKSQVATLCAISSSDENVTIPDYIKVGEEEIPVVAISGSSNFTQGFNSGIKTLTIPQTVTYINNYYSFYNNLEGLYMLGKAPGCHYRLSSINVYICDRSNLGSYFGNDYYANANLLPYGWDFEWITVNVEKQGEFAETYLTENNYDWGAVNYLKVTGNINEIDLNAIKNLTGLMKLDLNETSITSLPASFMYNRTSLTEIRLPSTLESIGNSAFSGCSSLKAFDLNGIQTIGSYVFTGCRSLENINLNGVISIGEYAFSECSSLANADLSTVVNIGRAAFANCSSLSAIDLSNCSNLGYEVFSYCDNLKQITLPKNIKVIPSSAFESTGLETIVLPEGVQEISSRAFYNCNSLTAVVLPGSVTTIGYETFKDCGLLEEISIPSRVKSIGRDAFANTGIKTFKCYAVVPPAAEYSFIGNGMDMTRTYLYVPPFSKDFYRNTPYWSDFYLMKSIEDQIDYLLVDRELTINLEEEDNYVVSNNPAIELTIGQENNYSSSYDYSVGQLTAYGEGTLSAGQLTIAGQIANRNSYIYSPTLINHADKMRADNVTHVISFYNRYNTTWHFMSLPYDVKVSDIVPSNNTYWVIRRYDSAARAAGETSSTWVNLTESDVMEAGKGYIISVVGGESSVDEYGYTITSLPRLAFTSGNSLTKNNIFRSGDVVVPLEEHAAEFAHNRSWNLVGNPYPAYFDMHFLNDEFTAPITVWNGSSYTAYSPVDDNLVLAPYEAFFVQCPLDATEMTFREEGRMHHNDGYKMLKSPDRNAAEISAEDRNVFNFTISSDNYEDRARIVLNPDAENGYEVGRDAAKFFASNADNAQIYVSGDAVYSISERPVSDGSATLGLRGSDNKMYTLSLSGKFSSEWHVMLTDNTNGKTVDLTENDYSFLSTADDDAARFSVRFVLGDNDISGIDSVMAEFGEDVLTVTTVDGVLVYSGKAEKINVPAAGIYVVSNGEKTRKMILK